MSPSVGVGIDVTEYRENPEQRTWDLPTWGHPLSKMVVPLFISFDGNFWPIGTAFWIGRSVRFVITAAHNIFEALRHEGRFDRELSAGTLPEAMHLRHAGLWILHQDEVRADGGRITLVPLEFVAGAPPTDVVVGYPQPLPDRQTISLPLSFDPPRIGQIVRSIGYTDFQPASIPIQDARKGRFDWLNSYHHRFVVTEGTVERIFIQRFTRGFTGGPCFAFDNAIEHGQSGGPIISLDNRIVGVNSAGATHFFNKPMTLGSMIYPLALTKLRSRNAIHTLLEWVARGVIWTDGSEAELRFDEDDPPGSKLVCPRALARDHSFIHDDFDGYQDGRPATVLD